jgi:hypothetical protein
METTNIISAIEFVRLLKQNKHIIISACQNADSIHRKLEIIIAFIMKYVSLNFRYYVWFPCFNEERVPTASFELTRLWRGNGNAHNNWEKELTISYVSG